MFEADVANKVSTNSIFDSSLFIDLWALNKNIVWL